MISERTLKKWRKEVLYLGDLSEDSESARVINRYNKRILKMTQELLDQHLIRK